MTGHMSSSEFRKIGHELIEWVANYWENIQDHPVLSTIEPGDVAERLPVSIPEKGDGLGSLVADLDQIIMPGVTHWQHPSFFGYFPANTSGPSVLGDLVSAGLGVQGMLWTTSPACTELETVTIEWLAQLLDLPERFRASSTGGGVIEDSASSSSLIATLAALNRASGGTWCRDGLAGADYVVYASTQAHSSVEKAARIAGLGLMGVRLVPADEVDLAMDADLLASWIAEDKAAGRIPALVVATLGTTSTTAFDPLQEIGQICQQNGIWLHVDAAYAGAAAICPEFRWMHEGIEYADSYCFNPHKLLLTGFDCSAFWVADRSSLIQTLSVLPEYLRNSASESGSVIDYRDWQIPLGRRFRALKLWMVLRWYGAEGLREHVRATIRLAEQFDDLVRSDARFERVTARTLGLVCFRLKAGNEINKDLLERVNADGAAFLTHTMVAKLYTLRFAVGSPFTKSSHVSAAWSRLQKFATEVLTTRATRLDN
ncbi:pyridoxal-dependent decarboxylase [Nocardia sp. NPDC049220]|uniref:pyridoxal-dependent decarboxylase n=1 Tax=Nocardia sp. NPDC049220 TaxID=3155273 RepID=UPI003401AC19